MFYILKELQGLIDEANQSLEESGTPSHEIMVLVLHREFTAGSIGITLAGGADYESKDITVILFNAILKWEQFGPFAYNNLIRQKRWYTNVLTEINC